MGATLLPVLDHYLRTARVAALLLNPLRQPVEPPEPLAPLPEVLPASLVDRPAAQYWFMTEYDALLVAVDRAFEAECYAHTWHLAWAVEAYAVETCRWKDWISTQQLALAAAVRLGDWLLQGKSHASLGAAYTVTGDQRRARTQLAESAAILGALGVEAELARTP